VAAAPIDRRGRIPKGQGGGGVRVIHIWIRRTVDWEDEDAALDQLTDPWLIPKVPLWNATFNISYQRFRYRVGQIAQLNHSRVEGAVRAEWHQIPDGALVLPVDDDDWFAPDAARALQRELDPGVTGYLWPSRWFEAPIDIRHKLYLVHRRLFPSTPPKWICTTNNYAVVKGPGAKALLGSHVGASRWFEGQLKRGDGSVKRIDGTLSVANRTLASQTTLSQRRLMIRRSELIRKFRRYRRLYDRPPPRELDWCQRYLKLMSELMGELELKDRA
jgi:hypothetical protein